MVYIDDQLIISSINIQIIWYCERKLSVRMVIYSHCSLSPHNTFNCRNIKIGDKLFSAPADTGSLNSTIGREYYKDLMTIWLQKWEIFPLSLSLSNTQKYPSLGELWEAKRLLLKQYLETSTLHHQKCLNMHNVGNEILCCFTQSELVCLTKAYLALHPKWAFIANDQMKSCPTKGISYISLHTKRAFVSNDKMKSCLTKGLSYTSLHPLKQTQI
jgi:hypothetical protein